VELLKGAQPATAVERDFLARSHDPLPELP